MGIDVLRGVAAGFAQVFMHNNPLAGAVLLLAVAANSSQHAACALLGALIGTLGGKALGIPAQNIRHGVCSFNGALIGIVLARYLGYGAMTLFLVAVCSASSLIMSGFISKTFHQPHYSLPFVLLIWLALFSTSVPIPAAGEASGGELDPALAVINGIGQTLFQTGKVSGALVLLALAIAEPIAAAIALGISVTVMLAAMLFGVSTSAINSGSARMQPHLGGTGAARGWPPCLCPIVGGYRHRNPGRPDPHDGVAAPACAFYWRCLVDAPPTAEFLMAEETNRCEAKLMNTANP
ncbi:MAG: urea transporter [Rhodocyclaceae bacterium]|nr:urea transporter [Rhodocyclaceae bacterium]